MARSYQRVAAETGGRQGARPNCRSATLDRHAGVGQYARWMRSASRPRSGTIVTCVAIVSLSCCGSQPQGAGSSTTARATGSASPTVLSRAPVKGLKAWASPPAPDAGGTTPTTAGMAALVGGTVIVDPARGCILLDRVGGPHLVVWPRGTTWTSDESALMLADGTVIRSGTRVRGGGGYLALSNAERLVGPIDDPVACGATDEVAVFNEGSPVEIVASS